MKSETQPDTVLAALPPTRFADWGRGPALLVLGTLLAALAWCLGVALTRETVPSQPQPEARGDGEFYHRVVERVQGGEAYYDVVADELAQRHYLPHSMFNWRPPVYAWVAGKLPSLLWARLLLGLGVLATMFLGYGLVRREAGLVPAFAWVVLMVGPFAWCCSQDVFLFAELWSGMLIALSLCFQARGQWVPAVAAGLLALFFRELALPYCLLALALACWQKRPREVAAWVVGLALFGLFLTFHALEVKDRLAHTGMVNAQGWVQFGGTAFVLLTCQINYFLILAPAWVTALYLPLALLGLAGWRSSFGGRAGLLVALYAAAFLVVGMKPQNAYWGLMYAPLLPFGLVWAPAALRDLIQSALRPAAVKTEPRSQSLPFLVRS